MQSMALDPQAESKCPAEEAARAAGNILVGHLEEALFTSGGSERHFLSCSPFVLGRKSFSAVYARLSHHPPLPHHHTDSAALM